MADYDRRLLTMLVAISEEGVMSRAARRLHVSQPALSKQLAQAERTTGMVLFQRHPRGMTATPAGRILVDRARAVLRELDEFSVAVQRARREVAGNLIVGYVAQTLNDHTRALIRDFEAQHPGIVVETRQYDLRDMTAGLLSGHTDVALLRQPVSSSQLFHEPMFIEPRVAVLYPDHPAATSMTTTLSQLFDTPWAVNTTDDPAFRAYQLAIGQRAGRTPVLGPVVHTIDEFLEAVISERAIGLAPASAARYYPRPGVVFVRVDDAEPSVCSLSWRGDRPSNAVNTAFIAHVRGRLPLSMTQ